VYEKILGRLTKLEAESDGEITQEILEQVNDALTEVGAAIDAGDAAAEDAGKEKLEVLGRRGVNILRCIRILGAPDEEKEEWENESR